MNYENLTPEELLRHCYSLRRALNVANLEIEKLTEDVLREQNRAAKYSRTYFRQERKIQRLEGENETLHNKLSKLVAKDILKKEGAA